MVATMMMRVMAVMAVASLPAGWTTNPTLFSSVGQGSYWGLSCSSSGGFNRAKVTGVPDYGMYTGYILADYAIDGLQKAGNPPTRQGLIDGVHNMGTYDQAGLACQPIDVSLAGRGHAPATTCGYLVQLKNGKFVLYPKSGKPIQGKLVGSPQAVADAKSGAAATATTTTAAPAAP